MIVVKVENIVENIVESERNTNNDLSNYEDENFDSSSIKNDVTTRLSKFMKVKAFINVFDWKINFKVDQVFESVEHFRKVLKNYNIQRGFKVRKIYNERRRINVVCKVKSYRFHLYITMMVDQ